MADEVFDEADDGSIVVRLQVQPGAGRTAVVGRHGDALKVRVAAPPERGRANEACIALVADLLGARPDDVRLVAGATSRTKRLAVTGVEADAARRALGDASSRPAGDRRADDDIRRRH